MIVISEQTELDFDLGSRMFTFHKDGVKHTDLPH